MTAIVHRLIEIHLNGSRGEFLILIFKPFEYPYLNPGPITGLISILMILINLHINTPFTVYSNVLIVRVSEFNNNWTVCYLYINLL